MTFDNVSATAQLITDRRAANRRISKRSVATALDVELESSDEEEGRETAAPNAEPR